MNIRDICAESGRNNKNHNVQNIPKKTMLMMLSHTGQMQKISSGSLDI